MHLIVLVGNIGTGKTTYIKKHFTSDEVILCPDQMEADGNTREEIQATLIKELKREDYAESTVIIDGLNMTKKVRMYFIFFAKKNLTKSTIIDFGSGDNDSLKRRIADPRGETPEFWTQTHNVNLETYEAPTDEEGYDEIITA
jgi:predicted kinase